jgi:hypothetical protein
VVRSGLDYDDIEGLEGAARTPKAHRRAAATLPAWAEEVHPDDGVSPAELLSAAGWRLEQAGDTQAALDVHRRTVAAPGPTILDARCALAAALLTAGHEDEARQVADELRRSRPRFDGPLDHRINGAGRVPLQPAGQQLLDARWTWRRHDRTPVGRATNRLVIGPLGSRS